MKNLDNLEKQKELTKYRDLALTTIDYYLEKEIFGKSNFEFDTDEHLNKFKNQINESFEKGKLTKLKQFFRDLTEMQIETLDLNFNSYLNEKTNYKIDIFKSFYERIERVISKGKISTDNQFYEINILINQLSHEEPKDEARIAILNQLIIEFEKRKH